MALPAAALARVAVVRWAAPASGDQARLYGPRSACLTARSVTLAVACQADGVRRAGQAAVGTGLDAGGLLGANDGLHQRPARRIRGQRRPRQRAQERGEHRSKLTRAKSRACALPIDGASRRWSKLW